MKAFSFPFWAVLVGLPALLLAGCVDPYRPDAIGTPKRYLVVDGFINAQGVTQIKLSRTYGLEGTVPVAERQAVVSIEEEGGRRFALPETTAGLYASAALTLNPTKTCRLLVSTVGGKQYASAYTAVKITPPIDDVTWKANPADLGIYLNSHDATGTTQYYRWDYEETWESYPLISPELEWVNRQMRPITVPYPYKCWITTKSTTINLSKTTALSQDVVSNFLLRSQANTSERLFSKYSILVKQFALSKEEYAYWELLKKNTENIGTLFDPLPSQLTGNIRCLNDENELALGYIGANTASEKRIFISRAELPSTWRVLTGYENCVPPPMVSLDRIPDAALTNYLDGFFGPNGSYVPVVVGGGGYIASTPDCVDCRRRGTAVRPSYWP